MKKSWSPFFGISQNQRNYKTVNNLFTTKVRGPFPTINQQGDQRVEKEVLEDIRKNQELITKQPTRRIDVVPSILEHNFFRTIEDQERKEWESIGLENGLDVWQFRNQRHGKIVKQMGDYIRYSLEDAEVAFAKFTGDEEKRRAKLRKNVKQSRFINEVEFSTEASSFTPQETEEVPFLLPFPFSLPPLPILSLFPFPFFLSPCPFPILLPPFPFSFFPPFPTLSSPFHFYPFLSLPSHLSSFASPLGMPASPFIGVTQNLIFQLIHPPSFSYIYECSPLPFFMPYNIMKGKMRKRKTNEHL